MLWVSLLHLSFEVPLLSSEQADPKAPVFTKEVDQLLVSLMSLPASDNTCNTRGNAIMSPVPQTPSHTIIRVIDSKEPVCPHVAV